MEQVIPTFRMGLYSILLAVVLWAPACSDDSGQVPCDGDGDCADGEVCHQGFCAVDDNDGFNILEPPVERGPRLFVESTVNFFYSEPGVSQWLPLEIHNGGTAPLDIDDIDLSDDSVFEITVIEERDEDGRFPEPVEGEPSFSPTSIDPGGDPLTLRVWFDPEDDDEHSADLTLFTNDADRREHVVELRSNFATSCLELSHRDGVDFQGVPVGETLSRTVQITNCSTVTELELFSLSISDSAGGAFAIDPDSYPGNLPGETLTIPPLEHRHFALTYTPGDEKSDEGELLITSTDEDTPQMSVPLSGQGVDGECPEARISASTEGSTPTLQEDGALEATPLDTVHFSAQESTGNDLSYQWSLIETPNHADVRLEPSADIIDPDLWLDLAGRYVVELSVVDDEGITNCEPAILEIDAIPEDDVYLELAWWVTGIYPPEGGEGTDLDLHYLHPNGNWGSTDWSVFSGAPTQSWDAGEAQLLIDDEWGEFPEAIAHNDPSSEHSFDVGVHYQWDLGFGTSFATVSVYLQGQLVWHERDRPLHTPNDLWHVGSVHWDDDPSFEAVDEMVDDHSLTSDEPDW